jgi:hypothetical protein
MLTNMHIRNKKSYTGKEKVHSIIAPIINWQFSRQINICRCIKFSADGHFCVSQSPSPYRLYPTAII